MIWRVQTSENRDKKGTIDKSETLRLLSLSHGQVSLLKTRTYVFLQY